MTSKLQNKVSSTVEFIGVLTHNLLMIIVNIITTIQGVIINKKKETEHLHGHIKFSNQNLQKNISKQLKKCFLIFKMDINIRMSQTQSEHKDTKQIIEYYIIYIIIRDRIRDEVRQDQKETMITKLIVFIDTNILLLLVTCKGMNLVSSKNNVFFNLSPKLTENCRIDFFKCQF